MTGPGFDTVRARVCAVVAAVTRTELPGRSPVSRRTVPQWDSLAHVEILFTVEEEFDVEFDEAAMRRAGDVDAITVEVLRLSGRR